MLKSPIIGQYIEALNNPYELFRTLGQVVPERDAYGELLFWSGNYSVIFKVRCEDGKFYAVKCYTRMPRHVEVIYQALGAYDSPYMVPSRYITDELYLYGDCENGTFYPITVMEWVEGRSLGGFLGELCRQRAHAALERLAVGFDQMARWLLAAEFAHGDLKQDNILVTPDGDFRLIDYDGAFIPALAGEKGTLVGSPAYQHPMRNENFYNKSIDDYAIALISLSLHTLSREPDLFFEYHDGENILFDAAEVQQGRCPLFARLMQSWAVEGAAGLLSLGSLMHDPTPVLDGLAGLLTCLCGEKMAHLPRDLTVVDDEDEHCALFRRNGLFGYVDLINNRILLQSIYHDATPFREGLAVVRLGEASYMIDREGKCRLDCANYQHVGPFSDGRARVCRDGLYGFIDREGVCVIPFRYSFATRFREGLAAVRVGSKYGYINTLGEEVIEPIFDYACCFRSGKARVEQSGRIFFIDRTSAEGQILS